jgi:hypothetical protein
MNMDMRDILVELQKHSKYTLVIFNYRGWPQDYRCFVRQIHWRHPDRLIITIKTDKGVTMDIVFTNDKQFIIWNDFIHPNCEIIVSTYLKNGPGGATKMGRTWAKFDPRYLHRAKDSVVEMPVAWNINRVKPECFRDLCFIID